jgi:hypothetical protein
MPKKQTKHVLPGGATRSEKAPEYHLVLFYGLRRTARRYGLGAEKHGEWNWIQSVLLSEEAAAAFCDEAFNHLMEHLHKMTAGLDPMDDHLGAVGWAQSALCYAEYVWQKPWTEFRRTNVRPKVTV